MVEIDKLGNVQRIFGMIVITIGWFFAVGYIMIFETPDVLSPYVIREEINMDVYVRCYTGDDVVPNDIIDVDQISGSSVEIDNICDDYCNQSSLGEGNIRDTQSMFLLDHLDEDVCLCSDSSDYC